jgi:hypothetical protein
LPDGKRWTDRLKGVIRGIGVASGRLFVALGGTLYSYEPPRQRR